MIFMPEELLEIFLGDNAAMKWETIFLALTFLGGIYMVFGKKR